MAATRPPPSREAPKGEAEGETPTPPVAAPERGAPRKPTGFTRQARRGGGNRDGRSGRGGRSRASGQGTARYGGARPRASPEERRPGAGSAGGGRPPPRRAEPGRAGRAPGQALTRAQPPPSRPRGDAPRSPQRTPSRRPRPLSVIGRWRKEPASPNKASTPLVPIGQRGHPVSTGSGTARPMETRSRRPIERRQGGGAAAASANWVAGQSVRRRAPACPNSRSGWAGPPAGRRGRAARARGCRHAHVQGEALPRARRGGAAARLHVPPAQPAPPALARRLPAAAAGRSAGAAAWAAGVGPAQAAVRGARPDALGRGQRAGVLGRPAGEPGVPAAGRAGSAFPPNGACLRELPETRGAGALPGAGAPRSTPP